MATDSKTPKVSPIAPAQIEIREIKKNRQQIEMENEILKKATALLMPDSLNIMDRAICVLLTKSRCSGVFVPLRHASWLAPCCSEYVLARPGVKEDPPRQYGTMRTPALSGMEGSNFREIYSACPTTVLCSYKFRVIKMAN